MVFLNRSLIYKEKEMSVEGFNLQRRRFVQKGDMIVIHFDPKQTAIEEVCELMSAISNIPERDRGTLFTIEPEGMWFRRV